MAQNFGMETKHFGTRLEAACVASGYKRQTEIARLFGVKPSVVSDYIRGKKMPQLSRICEVAPRLGVCVEWLLTGEGPRTPLPEWLNELSDEDRRRALAYLHIPPADRDLVDAMVAKLSTLPAQANHYTDRQQPPKRLL